MVIQEERTKMRQNETIISLLARQVIGVVKIVNIVTKNKRNPKRYIHAYNACNGQNGVNILAKTADVSAATISPILRQWEEEGIIYNVGEANRPLYSRLLLLSENTGVKKDE